MGWLKMQLYLITISHKNNSLCNSNILSKKVVSNVWITSSFSYNTRGNIFKCYTAKPLHNKFNWQWTLPSQLHAHWKLLIIYMYMHQSARIRTWCQADTCTMSWHLAGFRGFILLCQLSIYLYMIVLQYLYSLKETFFGTCNRVS